jgi:hypothetical protein
VLDQCGDRGAAGDRQDTEADAADRGERKDDAEAVAERVQRAGHAQQHQSHGQDRSPAEGAQTARHQQLREDCEQQQNTVHKTGTGGGRPAVDGPQGGDREQ